jgi:hypothetical protein
VRADRGAPSGRQAPAPQLDTPDRDTEQIARRERWASIVEILTQFNGVLTRTELGLIAEIRDFARFSHPRELCD